MAYRKSQKTHVKSEKTHVKSDTHTSNPKMPKKFLKSIVLNQCRVVLMCIEFLENISIIVCASGVITSCPCRPWPTPSEANQRKSCIAMRGARRGGGW